MVDKGPMGDHPRSGCFLCRRSAPQQIVSPLGQLRTTLTARPLAAVITALLPPLTEPEAGLAAICLKCSELVDQIDSLGLQLKLKTDELRTLYYASSRRRRE